jgi:hypothetical protein
VSEDSKIPQVELLLTAVNYISQPSRGYRLNADHLKERSFSDPSQRIKKEFCPQHSICLYRYEKIGVTRKHTNIEGNGKFSTLLLSRVDKDNHTPFGMTDKRRQEMRHGETRREGYRRISPSPLTAVASTRGPMVSGRWSMGSRPQDSWGAGQTTST